MTASQPPSAQSADGPQSAPAIAQNIVFLTVDNLDEAAGFYRHVLGLSLVTEQATCRIFAVVGQAAYLGLCQRQPDVASAKETSVPGLIWTVVVEHVGQVDAWYQRLQAHDVSCEAPPRWNTTYGIYHFFARDPDGYRLEFQCFERADWLHPL